MPSAAGKPDTICALATPQGVGAVAVVRVSGPDAFRVLDEVFDGPRPSRRPSHTVCLGWVRDREGERLDQVMLTVFRKPRSYTGEDMAEVSCHGGRLVSDEVIGLLLRHGCREAEPGEFARRALVAGKLTLSQAEATLDLINARSPAALRDALERYQGGLARLVSGLFEELRALHAEAEYLLACDEGQTEGGHGSQMEAKTRKLVRSLDRVIGDAERGRCVHDGVRVAIVGRPNVGKSSLFNRLLGEERAMVLPMAGTTRDRVEATTFFNELPVVLTDTAGIGLRSWGSSAVSRLAGKQTQSAIARADLVMAVFDGARPSAAADRAVLAAAGPRPVLCVVNKTDRPGWAEPVFLNGHPRVAVSALSGRNIGRLKAAVRRRFVKGAYGAVAGPRHTGPLRECRDALARSLGAPDLETRVLELNAAQAALARIDDPGADESVLDRIFARFCVGK